MTKIEKLYDHRYANARIYTDDDGNIALVSYNTKICIITPDGWIIPCYNPACSNTTIKHVGWFMHEKVNVLGYHDLKRAYKEHYRINMWTGEIEELN